MPMKPLLTLTVLAFAAGSFLGFGFLMSTPAQSRLSAETTVAKAPHSASPVVLAQAKAKKVKKAR
jgi:hypothetical protein